MKTVEAVITGHGVALREECIAARKERLTNLLASAFTELEDRIVNGIQTYRMSLNHVSGGDLGWETAREEWMRFCWPDWMRSQRRAVVADAIRCRIAASPND
ncbi:MAG TPA: hypothetical protein VLZ12_05150 [Verrucomicrobiae bacterium]|nr:hypothetical protein [Verrucomicrobiae bacterium]